MLKTRRGLLVTLVLVSVAVAAAWSNHDVAAGTRSGSASHGNQFVKSTATLEGEPDVGQIHQQPASNTAPPIVTVSHENRWRFAAWLRLASEIWMVRYLGSRLF
jgi:hypothetical protein